MFQGIMLDIGVMRYLIGGYLKYITLRRESITITKINRRDTDKAKVGFKLDEQLNLIETAIVSTIIRAIPFYILKSPTPFLLYLENIKTFGVNVDVNADELVKNS